MARKPSSKRGQAEVSKIMEELDSDIYRVNQPLLSTGSESTDSTNHGSNIVIKIAPILNTYRLFLVIIL
jgi:hypothetical protein